MPDFFYVRDASGREVQARSLTDINGNYIINPRTGQPYIVPYNYNISNVDVSVDRLSRQIESVLSQSDSLSPGNQQLQALSIIWSAFGRGGSDDLQRTYNSISGGGGDAFVDDFRDVASLHYGIVMARLGYNEDQVLRGGGAYNWISSLFNGRINTSGDFGNNPRNAQNIRAAFDLVRDLRVGSSVNNRPIGLENIPRCFLAGTPILMADGSTKPIEEIRPGDEVASFDPDAQQGLGPLQPGKVTRTFTNITRTIINLRGTHMTPGHVVLMDDGEWDIIARALKDDRAIVEECKSANGGSKATLVRARSGALMGSPEDTPITITFRDPATSRDRVAIVRAGIPALGERLEDGDLRLYSMADVLLAQGYSIASDGSIISKDGQRYDGAPWASDDPPDALEFQQNWIIELDGKAYTPPWIAGLPQEQEDVGQMVVNAGPAPASRSGAVASLNLHGRSSRH